MNKTGFVLELADRLDFLPFNEVQERIEFYTELIDERMDHGLSEEEAIAQAGSVDEIVSQILADIPLSTLVKQKITAKKRFSAWELILLVLGSPIWLSLLISAFAVGFSLYISLWAVIISFWSVFGAMLGCALGGVIFGAVMLFIKNIPVGLASIAAALLLSGLSMFLFHGCKAATTGMLLLTKKVIHRLKIRFAKKEVAQ